jgi:hypothetical protein
MSNSHPTKSRSKQNKKRKPNYRLSAHKARVWVNAPLSEDLDDESRSVIAALEWMNFDDDMREVITGLGIFDEEAYIDVRVGMKHASGEELIIWASKVSIGHAQNHEDLENYFDGQIQALSMAVRWEKYHTRIDILAQARAATRHMKITNTIRWHDLPSGAKYYYAPYELGSDEHIMWLLKYSRKFERP